MSNSAENIKWDLLDPKRIGGQPSRRFKVTFDYFTPRSHFIFLPKESWGKPADFINLKDDDRQDLLDTAARLVDVYELQDASPEFILHRGSWFTAKNRFHAHLRVDVATYLRIFSENEAKIPGWPDRSFVTGQWKASKDPRRYADNVKGYPYKTYIQEDIKELDLGMGEPTTGLTTYAGEPLFYHKDEPRVGFTWQAGGGGGGSLPSLRQELLNRMEEFAQKQRLSGPGMKDGCHLVLNMKNTVGFPDFEEQRNVHGYVQMSALCMYKICPDRIRRTWAKEFKRAHPK